jgi:hypothetical protein
VAFERLGVNGPVPASANDLSQSLRVVLIRLVDLHLEGGARMPAIETNDFEPASQRLDEYKKSDCKKYRADEQAAHGYEKERGLFEKARAYFSYRSRGVGYQPVEQRIHLRPRLSNPTRMPATIAISTATKGLRSIVVSRSVRAPATRSCALLAVSEIFCRALATASKTVFVVAAVCVRINSDTDEVNFATSSRSSARR